MNQLQVSPEIREIEGGIRQCLVSILEDSIRIGQLLSRAKKLLPHGEYLSWLEGVMSRVRAAECVWLAEAYTDQKSDIYRLLVRADIKTKSNALLFRSISDDVLANILSSGRLGDTPIAEVGRLSYRELERQIRALKSPAPVSEPAAPEQLELFYRDRVHVPLNESIHALTNAQDGLSEWVLHETNSSTSVERRACLAMLDELDATTQRLRLLLGTTPKENI